MNEPPPDRRGLLQAMGAAIAGAAGAAVLGSAATAEAGEGEGADEGESLVPGAGELGSRRRRRWGMVIDLDRCTTCGACTVACRQENNVPVFDDADQNHGTYMEWMSILWQEDEQGGGLPTAMPFPCQHCADAPCVKACPVGATFTDPEGITQQIWERCIGCRYCMVSCPYGRRSFNWQEPKWDGTLVQLLNPDVATRPKGVVEKCTFCNHRLRRVKETAANAGREVTDDDVRRLPACASACPANAITFGDLHDPDSSVSQQAESPRAFRLLEHLGTEPGVVYLKRDRRS